MTHVAAVILAAGSGSRLGGTAKALIRIDGVPLVLRLINAVQGAGIADVLVVTGSYHDAIAQLVAPTGVRVARNMDAANGQSGSVRLGLQHTDPHAEAVMVMLCDQPLLTSADLVELVDAFHRRAGGEFVVPRVKGHGRGNPVMVSRSAVHAILASTTYVACRDYMDAHPALVSYLDTRNDHYAIDIDVPQDLATVGARLSCTVELPASP
ncbi:MAG: nucleotidyltransferase family protein [Burkholderiaceae bacterium]